MGAHQEGHATAAILMVLSCGRKQVGGTIAAELGRWYKESFEYGGGRRRWQ